MADTPKGGGNGKAPRGFAAMDAERRRAIASKGGRSVPREKRSFARSRDLATAAGRKGGAHGHDGSSRGPPPEESS